MLNRIIRAGQPAVKGTEMAVKEFNAAEIETY